MGDTCCSVGIKGLAEGARVAAWTLVIPLALSWAPLTSLPHPLRPLDNLQRC